MSKLLLIILVPIFIFGCSAQGQRGARSSAGNGELIGMMPSIPDLASGEEKPPSFEEAGQTLGDAGERWLFGDGIGKTMVNVAGVVVFPPYAIYLLGNAGLALFGEEPIYVTDILPEEPREGVLTAFDAVTSVPGLVVSTVTGQEFHTPERLR